MRHDRPGCALRRGLGRGVPWAVFLLAFTTAIAELPVQTLTRTYGPYELKPGGLMQRPGGDFFYKPEEPIWVVSYGTEILREDGTQLPDYFHCHTTFRRPFAQDWLAWSAAQKKIDVIPFKGLFSDGHTTEMRLPEGFGIPFSAGESVRLVPMFNNRFREPLRASMRITLRYIRAADLDRSLTPLYSMIQSVQYPHLYMVPPGIDKREIAFNIPFKGRLHAIASHIHPYGQSTELINDTRGESVWKSVGERGSNGQLVSMPVYSDVEGYEFEPDESYRLVVTYDNPTGREQDAMGGLFMYFSTETDSAPCADLTGIELPAGVQLEQPEPACHAE